MDVNCIGMSTQRAIENENKEISIKYRYDYCLKLTMFLF